MKTADAERLRAQADRLTSVASARAFVSSTTPTSLRLNPATVTVARRVSWSTATASATQILDDLVSKMTDQLAAESGGDEFVALQPDPQQVDLRLLAELETYGTTQSADLASWYAGMLDD